MHHTREEIIERTKKEYDLLDKLLAKLTEEQWDQLLLRPEGKDPWTVKDAVAHITHWKADVARSIRKQHQPIEERGLDTNSANHLIYLRWHSRSPREVLTWHRQVQEDLLEALRDAPEEWFSKKERGEPWPYDLDGHSAFHRSRDIERRALKISR
jgi:hypothetical protein